MAVENPCLKKEWEEWKREMEETRRRRWRERVSRWSIVEEMEEEEDEEEMKMREAKETEEEGENEVTKRVEEIEKIDEEEDGEASEAEEKVDVKKDENDVEDEVKENVEVDEDEEIEVKNADEVEVKREAEVNEEVDLVQKKEVNEVEEMGEEEDEEEMKMREAKETEEEEENEVTKRVEEIEKIDEEEDGEASEAEEKVDVKKDENDVEDEVKENVEVDEDEEIEVKNADEVEVKREAEVNEEVDLVQEKEVNEVEEMGEEADEEDDDEEEEHQDQEEIAKYCLAEQFKSQVRTEEEHIQQNQESMRRGVKTVNEEESSQDAEESSENSDLTESEDECYNFETTGDKKSTVKKKHKDFEELKDLDEKSWGNKKSALEVWTSKERKEQEDDSEKLTNEVKTVAESWITQEEEFQEDDEESTEDEEAEHSADEDVDNNEEDVTKMYHKDDYPTDVFSTLTEFRDASLLTDLTLSTEDGKSFHVHSPVLAAVSSLIWESLNRRNMDNNKIDDKKDRGVHSWLVSLGSEVDHVGLKAVVEFAYTGRISCLNKDTAHQIKAAAQRLGVPRVLNLCTEEEEKSAITAGHKKEEGLSAAEQMAVSLQSIKQLWTDKVGCDVILEAVGGPLHVHRVILAAQSDYFRSMFTLGMKESRQPCVTLPYLLASELEVLIECSYSGALPLSWTCVFEITSTALQLQYQPALCLCFDFLQREINPHFCLDVASFAEAYEMLQLLEVADDFVLRQFQKVASTSKFKDLPAEKLLRYLNSHSLCVPSELVVFKAVAAWIQAKPKKRLRLAKVLMKTIHFPLMTFKEFKEVQSVDMWSNHSLAELYEAVFEDFCSKETELQSQCRIYLPKDSLVLIGGDQTSEDFGSRSISRELWFGNSLRNHTGIKKAMEWRRLGEMPDPARFSHEVTVLNGQLYVFGGKRYYGTNDTLKSVYRYDPLQNSWETLAEMQEKRCSFSVVVLDGKIYAIGGHCEPDYIESVEQYCPTANSWSFSWPLNLPLSSHVAKVLQGQIFVSGGLSSDYQCLSSMFLYHPKTGSTYLANMAKPRAHHCMETLGKCLYVAGGITTDDNVTFVDQLACEVYNPVADSWTAFTSLPVPHVGAGSAVLEGKFYVLGGYSHEDYSDTKMVHRFDPTVQKWENMGKMPGPNNDIRASLLCLPTHFRQ